MNSLLIARRCLVTALYLGCAAAQAADSHDPGRSYYPAPRALLAPKIDGSGDDKAWSGAPWRPVNQRWLGPTYDDDDFRGHYKVVWTEQRIYILFEFVDDRLIDRYRDPLVQYWDDDTLEIFVDENHSGGNHQYNHNAFAYHVALDNQAIDIGTDRKPRTYNHHIESRWRQYRDNTVWEVSLRIYPDSYDDAAADNTPVTLFAGKTLGFMLAYCDNDGSDIRENFIGSEYAAPPQPDRGWIDAGLFGTLELVH